MASIIALSSIWRLHRFPDLGAFFSSAEQAGFSYFELDRSISLQEISDLSLPEEQILSLEIPCPAHRKNYAARFASLDRYERDAARDAARNSFQLAEDLQAQVVIVNLGRTEVRPELEEALYEGWRQGGSETSAYQDLRKELVDTRARNADPHIKAALYDVEYLANLAQNAGVKLAITTPKRYADLALPEEMQIVLETFGDPVYYWHDLGQAQIFQTLDLLPESIWLEQFAEQMIGLHLHNTQGLDRYLPPQLTGDISVEHVKDVLAGFGEAYPAATLITCKFAATHKPEAITEGLNLVKSFVELT